MTLNLRIHLSVRVSDPSLEGRRRTLSSQQQLRLALAPLCIDIAFVTMVTHVTRSSTVGC